MSNGIDWPNVRLAIRNWIVAGVSTFVAADHVIWVGQNHVIPSGMYVTLEVVDELEYGFDRSVYDNDGTEHLIGDRTIDVTVTVYGGLPTSDAAYDATLPWRVASRALAARRLSVVADALAAGSVGVLAPGKIATPGRGLNSTAFEARAMFTATLAVVSDISVTGAAAGTTISTVNGSGKVDTVDPAVTIHQTLP